MRALIAAAVAAGCGAEVVPPPPRADAGAGGDAAVAGPVTVDVREVFAPVGIPVIDGLVAFIPRGGGARVVPTDVDGRAAAALPDGGVVAIARSRFGQRDLTVFIDVAPGAALIDGPPLPAAPGGADLGAREATVAPYDGVALLGVSCGVVTDGFGGGTLAWRQPDCATVGDATLVATATDAAGQRQFAVRHHVDLRSDAVVAMPAWQAMPTVEVVLTNIPVDVISASVALTQDDGDVAWNRDFAAGPVEGASLVLTLPVVPGDVPARLEIAAQRFGQAARLVRARGRIAPRTAVDVGGAAPPWLGTPTLVPATRTVAWSYAGGGGRRPDVVLATFGIAGPDGAPTTIRVIAPGDVVAVALPPLPPELAAWDVATDALVFDARGVAVDVVGLGRDSATASVVNQADRLGASLGRGPVPVDLAHDWWIVGG